MKIFYSLFIFSSFLFLGCSSDNQPENCVSYKHGKITSVDSEESSVKKNEDLAINISYLVDNSCGIFNDFEVIRDNKIYEIKLKTKYEGCSCNEMVTELATVYHFRATESGFYTLNFSVSNTEYITKVVFVE